MPDASGPICDECGGPFNPDKWDIKHRPGCSQGPRPATPANQVLRKTHQGNDKKMVFLENWKIIFPDLWRKGRFVPDYDPEHAFATEMGRGWLFDFAWVPQRVAVEIDGGNRMATIAKDGRAVAIGRHTQESDYEKLAYAVSLGWWVFRFTPQMIESDPVRWCGLVYKKICDVWPH